MLQTLKIPKILGSYSENWMLLCSLFQLRYIYNFSLDNKII